MQEYDPVKLQKQEKKIGKVIRRGMILIGCGLGFLILTAFEPQITDEEKTEALTHLFHLCGISIIVYAFIIILPCFFYRKNAVLIDVFMSWFVAPCIALWFGLEVFEILSQ